MTKRSTNADSSTPRSIIGTLILAVILVVAVVVGGITGVDLVSLLGLATPTATVQTARPTSPTLVPTAPATLVPTVPVTLAPATAVPPVLTQVANLPGGVLTFTLPQGFGAQKGFWQVYFTAPGLTTATRSFTNGIEFALASAIRQLQPGNTLDIAAFEFNLPVLTGAVLDAHQRGVRVRMVTDTQRGLQNDDSTVPRLVEAGIPVVDDKRSAFMHNKFMILNGATVWTGSWNFTLNDTYRNNNNALALRSRRLVERYQAEFDQMFNQKLFGPSKAPSASNVFTQDGVPIQIYFAPEDKVLQAIIDTIAGANTSIRFLTFSFTDYDIAKAIIDRVAAKPSVQVQGVFETTGSETDASELRTLRCAGLDARQDTGGSILHHKLFIVDDAIVITGSFNISTNATVSNDENLVIIPDRDLAAQYVAEFNRRWSESRVPSSITCG